jgi:mRNA interferase HigB
VRVYSLGTLRQFWLTNAAAEEPLKTWYRIAERGRWNTFQDVRRDINSVDLVGSKLIFNIGGNNYRLICHVHFGAPGLYVVWIGNHGEYSRLSTEDIKAL